MEDALRAGDAEYIEIRVEDVADTDLTYRGEELDHVGSAREVGGIVRALVNGGWGSATFNELENLRERVREACESARLVGSEESHFAEAEPVAAEIRSTLKHDFRDIPLNEKRKTIEEYNKIVLGYHEKIETSRVSYSDFFRKVWFANSEGTWISDERPGCAVRISATARDGDNVQHGYQAASSVNNYQIVEGRQALAEQAAQKAVELLSAPPVKGGAYTVITNPILTGVFCHEAFGHLSEADHVYENDRMQEIMVLGKRFGPEILNIIDDGSKPGLWGSITYDDEGVKARKNYLIREGVLVGRLHSRETAAKMKEGLTGNARSTDYDSEPMVRMTNTYVDEGKTPFEEMIKDVRLGLYACDCFGGQTAMEMFTFSAGYGYMIRDGKIAELVRDVVLTGNVFETLQNVEAVGNRLEWPEWGGMCGKGHGWLPVADGGPHVRIRNVVVGGRQ
jgi:TldD protein